MSLILLCLAYYQRRDDFLFLLSLALAASLLCLSRPNFLAVMPFLFFLLLFRQPNRFARQRVLFAVMLWALPLFSFWAINSYLHGSPQPFTGHAGSTFILGASSDSDVFNYHYPEGQSLSLFNPSYWGLTLKKFFGYFRSLEVSQNINFYIWRETMPFLRLFFIPHAFIAVLGILFTLFFLREKKYHPILILFWGGVITVSFFYIVARFRLPQAPILCLMAGIFIAEFGKRFFEFSTLKKMFTLIFMLLLFFWMNPFEEKVTRSDAKAVIAIAIQRGKDATAARLAEYGFQHGGGKWLIIINHATKVATRQDSPPLHLVLSSYQGTNAREWYEGFRDAFLFYQQHPEPAVRNRVIHDLFFSNLSVGLQVIQHAQQLDNDPEIKEILRLLYDCH